MPQQPAGAGSPSFIGNTTGTGAVFFDSAPDLLSVHMGNLNQFEQGLRRKEAQKAAAVTAGVDMFKGMKLGTEGILDTDTDMFQERANGINDYIQASLKAGIDPTQAGAGAFQNQMKRLTDQYNLDAKVSATQREAAAEALKVALSKPDEYDLDATQKNVEVFGALPFDQRNKNINWATLAVPRKKSYLELVAPFAEKIKPAITETQLKNGLIGTEKTEEYFSPEKIDEIILATPTMVEKAWQGLSQGAKDNLLQQQFAAGVTDQDLALANAKKEMAKQDLQLYHAVQKDIDIHGESEARKQGAKLSARAKEGSVLPVNISTFATGDPKFNKVFPYDIGTTTYADGTPLPKEFTAPNTFYGTQSLSWPIGTYKSVNVWKDENGNTQSSPDTAPQPNAVEVAFHTKDGGYAIQTTETRKNFLNKIGKTPFLYFKTPAEMMQYVGTKLKASGDQTGTDVLADANLFLQETKNGTVGGFDANKVHPLTKEEQDAKRKNLEAVGIIKPVQQQVAQQSKPSQGKTTTRSKIKALVGTKGYEGYTEQELIDYYKSQGYTIQ